MKSRDALLADQPGVICMAAGLQGSERKRARPLELGNRPRSRFQSNLETTVASADTLIAALQETLEYRTS